MIGLKELGAGIAGYLTDQTGLPAFANRAEGAVYPCLTVESRSKSVGIIACGRQVERQVTVTVTCHASRQREREAELELADRVYEAVVPGFQVCGRGFGPKEAEIRTDSAERAQVSFLLEFCDTPSQKQSSTATAFETMGALSLRLEQEREGS